ncbi:MAG: selenide, water dikinase SelD [Planctomycetota bacterium]
MSEIRLTQYSHGAGCGCKIAPNKLATILESQLPRPNDPRLLVGNESKDDAAVYDLGDGRALVSTTDFFMPIVDDPFTFGRIAATNAISDVYAMGGRPLLAIAILGWPLDKLDVSVARDVVEGGRQACADAGIALAGGHSIDCPEPIFGLAVTGLVEVAEIKRNDRARAGDVLLLSKPLGVGLLTTAEKKGKLRPEDRGVAAEAMCQLNRAGAALGPLAAVHAMTDVTGFGLLGHLIEMCEGSGVSAEITFSDVPTLSAVDHYIAAGTIPGGTGRNWDSYGQHVLELPAERRALLCDPQTSGGLLVAVDPAAVGEVRAALLEAGALAAEVGRVLAPRADGKLVAVL